MKILCVSDQIDPLIYNSNAKKNFADIDLVLCAGDLPLDYLDFIVSVLNKPVYFIFGNHDLKEYKYYHSSHDTSSKAARSVNQLASNSLTRTKAIDSHSHGAVYAGFKVLANNSFLLKNPRTGKKTPLLIAGASGSRKYNNGLCQFTETQMRLKLLALIPQLVYNKIRYGRYLDIFLTHASPLNIHDAKDRCHIGFDSFNWFIKRFCPSYMIHGHIHLYDQREERIGKYWNTIVVNAYAHCVIEFPVQASEKEKQNISQQNITSDSNTGDV
ncbi:MAG: metallophosphoesterase [Treponema sp.]|nr:metallophosphoesterase [Treponema sp.]